MTETIVAFAARELALELTPNQAEMLGTFEAGDFGSAVWQCGRRGGKSLLADVLVLFDATVRNDLRQHLRPGEPRVAAIIAPRLEQAQAHITSISGLIAASPGLSGLLVSQSADSLVFANGSEIRAYPCSARTIRGGAWSSVVLDELGHFVTTEEGNAAGDRILEAAVPATAQFGSSGWLISISTPMWRSGAFFKLVERVREGRSPRTHYRHLSTAAMNPRIPAAWLEERRLEDPELYAREFMAEFVDGASSYFAAEDVIACRRGVGVLPAQPGTDYRAALDPAYSQDSFAMAIGHRQDDIAIVDGVWAWRRYGHERTLDAIEELAKEYGVFSLRTDQYAAVPVIEGLRKRGLGAVNKPWSNENKTAAFSRLKIGLNTRQVELPDDSALVEELLGVEAKPTPGGLTRIAASGSGHDDRAVVVAALAEELLKKRSSLTLSPPIMFSRSAWLGEGQAIDEHQVAVGSFANAGAPPQSAVPAGAKCPTIDRDGYTCASERFHDSGECIRCGKFYPGTSPGRKALMPVLVFKSAAR